MLGQVVWSYKRSYALSHLSQAAQSGSRTAASLDSLHAAAGLCWCKYPSLQKTPAPKSPHPHLQSPGTRKDPPGSDLWPGGSCCIVMLSTRTNVQTQAAPKRRGVGLRARSGEEAGTAGRAGRAVYRWLQHAPTSRLEPPPSGAESGCVREAVWRPHCGYRHCLLCAV